MIQKVIMTVGSAQNPVRKHSIRWKKIKLLNQRSQHYYNKEGRVPDWDVIARQLVETNFA